MSSPVDAAQAWASEYQARFGAAPGTQEAKAELERCVQLCQELLAERERLRAELARVQAAHDMYYHAFGSLMKKELAKIPFDKESLLAESVDLPPLDELLAELEREGT